MQEEKSLKEDSNTRKEVTFTNITDTIVLEENEEEGEEEEEAATCDKEVEEEQVKVQKVVQEETGFRTQSGRVTCIVCGVTRNTNSQINKHMKEQKLDGEFVPAGQVYCGLVAFPDCPFQCKTKIFWYT